MKSYIEAIYKKFDVENALKRAPQVPVATKDSGNLVANQEPYKKPFDYRSAVGSIQWCSTVARPDIARPVNLMAKWNNEVPTKNRVTALLKIIAYLYFTREHGITYSPRSHQDWKKKTELDGHDKTMMKGACGLGLYTDASWATEIENSYSVSGMVITAFGTPVAWKSQRQSVRADSTCAAEYIAAADGINWMALMGHLEFSQIPAQKEGSLPKTVRIMIDSTSALQVAKAEEGKPKTRWLALRWHRLSDEKDRLVFVKTTQQKADVLTKAPKLDAIRLIFGDEGLSSLGYFKKTQYEYARKW